MRVEDIVIGETYNYIKILRDLGYHRPDHRYVCQCVLCGKEFEIAAKHIGAVKTCRDCSEKSKMVDLSGKRFGRLVAIEVVGRTFTPNGTRQTMWRCKCDCGNETTVKYIALTSGNTKSCGCGEIENRMSNIRKAQLNNRVCVSPDFDGCVNDHPLYATWCSMFTRCYNPKRKGHKHYGGRGIKVCERWSGELGFEHFVQDMRGRPTPKYSIDRIDVNGDYCPENCRWATDEQQANNKTTNVYITVGNRRITAKQFCNALGLNYWVAIKQIQRGYDINLVAKNVRFNKGVYRRRSNLINYNLTANDELADLLTCNIDEIKGE